MKNSFQKHKNSEKSKNYDLIPVCDSSMILIKYMNLKKNMKLKAMNLKDVCSLEGYDKTR